MLILGFAVVSPVVPSFGKHTFSYVFFLDLVVLIVVAVDVVVDVATKQP